MSRRRIRPLLALAGGVSLAFALTACGSSGSDDVNGASTGSPDSAGAPSASPLPSASTGSVTPACAAIDLKGAVKTLGAAAGTAYYAVQVTNEGGSACALRGFDTVTLQDASGDQLGAAARTQGHAKGVVLRAGQSASRRVGIGTAANYPASTCKPKAATDVAVSSSTPSSAVRIPLKVKGCASTAVTLLTAKPFRAVS